MKLKWEDSKKDFIEKFHIDVLDKDEPEFREITNKLDHQIKTKAIIVIIMLTIATIISLAMDYGDLTFDINSAILVLIFLFSMCSLTCYLASKGAKAQADFVTYVQQQRALEKIQREHESLLHKLSPETVTNCNICNQIVLKGLRVCPKCGSIIKNALRFK